MLHDRRLSNNSTAVDASDSSRYRLSLRTRLRRSPEVPQLALKTRLSCCTTPRTACHSLRYPLTWTGSLFDGEPFSLSPAISHWARPTPHHHVNLLSLSCPAVSLCWPAEDDKIRPAARGSKAHTLHINHEAPGAACRLCYHQPPTSCKQGPHLVSPLEIRKRELDSVFSRRRPSTRAPHCARTESFVWKGSCCGRARRLRQQGGGP